MKNLIILFFIFVFFDPLVIIAQVDTAWVRHYDQGEINVATDMAIDGSGNIYVSGVKYDSGAYSDYTTIKYNSSGVEQWIAHYNGPGDSWDKPIALAVDDSGNVYVTGLSVGFDTSYDYATVKYNAAGVEQWVNRFYEPGNDWEMPSAIAVDGSGNIYVTGKKTTPGPKMLDGPDSKYWTEHSNKQNAPDGNYIITIKYNTSGIEQWIARYNGSWNVDDEAHDLTVDVSGNVYVTGSSSDSSTWADYTTIKYDSSGVEQWVAYYNGPGNFTDYASSIAIDHSGNVYVTGTSDGSGTSGWDYTTIKYDSSGVEQWVTRYNGPGNSYDMAIALAVDSCCNVYVTGTSDGSGTSGWDYATIKYNASGVEQWVARYDGLGDWSQERVSAIAVDSTGNIFVTGSSEVFGTSDDYVTIKYNASGVEQWVARYTGPETTMDRATTLVVDGSNNVYVTGTSGIVNTSDSWIWSRYTTIKYTETGTPVIEHEPTILPKDFSLSQNYPNPFNPTTVIKYQLPIISNVRLSIFNILGQKVRTLVSKQQPAGIYKVEWDASGFASGVYFFKLLTNNGYVQTKKLILLK